MLLPLLVVATKAILRPSGDQAGDQSPRNPVPIATRRTRPVPSWFTRSMPVTLQKVLSSPEKQALETNATWLPSGDQAGSDCRSPFVVTNAIWPEPSGWIVEMFAAEKAIRPFAPGKAASAAGVAHSTATITTTLNPHARRGPMERC